MTFPNYWLLQSHPDRFDMEGFLATRPDRAKWLVPKYGQRMRVGDNVVLWRAKGGSPEHAGVVALGCVADLPADEQDTWETESFWLDGAGSQRLPRVALSILHIRPSPVDYDDLRADPRLVDALIFRQPQGTDFPLERRHAEAILDHYGST